MISSELSGVFTLWTESGCPRCVSSWTSIAVSLVPSVLPWAASNAAARRVNAET
jgi:hypothetical protein